MPAVHTMTDMGVPPSFIDTIPMLLFSPSGWYVIPVCFIPEVRLFCGGVLVFGTRTLRPAGDSDRTTGFHPLKACSREENIEM